MISYFQAIVLGLLQGAFELFPVSSLGHSIVLPQLFGWDIHENDNAFIIFLVATHLATALVLIGFYWKSWVKLTLGLLRTLRHRKIDAGDVEARLIWLLIIGTIPAGILGLLFQHKIQEIFVTAQSAAFFLIMNGFLLLGFEALRRRRASAPAQAVAARDTRLSRLSWMQAIKIGTAQALALIPGFSRSGASMGGGLLAGLNNEDAAHFSFMLATPIILAAGILKLPELAKPENHALLGPSIVGALFSALSAYLTVRFLTKYFHTNSLKPFGIYCLIFGVVASLILMAS